MAFDLSVLDDTAWLFEPVRLQQTIQRVLSIPTCPSARELVKIRAERLDAARAAPAQAIRSPKGRVGLVAIHGPLEQRMNAALEKAGGTSMEEAGLAFDALMATPDVGAIILHIDSPGGSVYGTQELADKIYQARGSKKIYAIADSLAASAALWIASAADQVYMTPGGDVGSVGVYIVHLDQSEKAARSGVKVSVISAGQYKTEGHPFAPLADETKAHLQERVDAMYSKFLAGLARNRSQSVGSVQKNFGQGRLVRAEQALAAGMVDRIMTLDDLIGRLTDGQAPAGSGRRASAEVLRLRHEHAKARG